MKSEEREFLFPSCEDDDDSDDEPATCEENKYRQCSEVCNKVEDQTG